MKTTKKVANYFDRAVRKNKSKNYMGAIKDYNKVIEIDPESAEAYSNRAVAKSNLGLDREAIKDFNKAIKLNPDYAEAYNNRGITKFLLTRKKDALKDLTKAGELGYLKAYKIIGEIQGLFGRGIK